MKLVNIHKFFGYGLCIIACALAIFVSYSTQSVQNGEIYTKVLQLYNQQTNAQNAVASIYLNYRVYDTIFEALMLLVSVLGVIHFSRHEHNVIVHSNIKTIKTSNIALMVPVIIILGMYIIVNGHITPGGGFQGGAALSAAFICVYLVNPNRTISIHKYEIFEKLLFLTLTIIALVFAAGNLYLQYPTQNLYYLVLMNVLIGLKVFFGLSIVFFRFVHYEDT